MNCGYSKAALENLLAAVLAKKSPNTMLYHGMIIAGAEQVKNIVQTTFFRLLKIAAAKEENLRSRSSQEVQRPGLSVQQT